MLSLGMDEEMTLQEKKINKITVMEHHNKKTVCEKKVRINRKISRKLLTTKNKQGRNRKSLLEI